MIRSLMLSIQPQHLYNILTGNKTLELRKSVPKDFKGWVYLYCTKSKPRLSVVHDDENGQTYYYLNSNWGRELNTDIFARFWFDEYDDISTKYRIDKNQIERVIEQAYIGYEDFDNYVGDRENVYGWHIKRLEIIEPMALSDFITTMIPDDAIIDHDMYGKEYFYRKERPAWNFYFNRLTKAPQSYQYVYVKE